MARPPVPKQPDPIQREYLRFLLQYTKAYERIVRQEMGAVLPGARERAAIIAPGAVAVKSEHMDAGVVDEIVRAFGRIAEKLRSLFPDTLLQRWATTMIKRSARLSAKNQADHIRRATKRLKAGQVEIGGILDANRHLNPFFTSVVDQNVMLIKSISEDRLPALRNAITASVTQDLPYTELAKIIQLNFKQTKNKAKFIAVDQVNKLNGSLDEYHQKVLGVRKYRWRTMRDGAVRHPASGKRGPDHKHLEGEVFSWDGPGGVVDTKTGRRAHPKQDFRCRCYAEAVLDDLLS